MASIDEEKRVLTVMEASRLARMSRGSMYEAIRQGTIKSVRFGRKILVPRAALEKLLDGDGDGQNGHGP